MSNTITYYGHSAFKIVTGQGLRIWIDPWLDNPMAPEDHGETESDLILVTHAHPDHLGNTMELAASSMTEVVAVHELQQYLLARGLPNVTGMNIGGTYHTKGISVTMVQAVHSSSISNGNELLYGGEAAGFIIRLEDGVRIYHAGDTALFGDMAMLGSMHSPKVAMLPIGDHYVMGPRDAVYACRLINPRIVIPMHYKTFPVLTGTPGEFERQMKANSVDIGIRALKPGESIDIDLL